MCDIHDPSKNNDHVQHTFTDAFFVLHMLLLCYSHHPVCIHIHYQTSLISIADWWWCVRGFFLAYEDFRRVFDNSVPTCASKKKPTPFSGD